MDLSEECTEEVICQMCQYWEDRADINTENEIKMKIKNEETTVIAIPVQETKTIKPVGNTANNKVTVLASENDNRVGKPKSPQ
tara:strand:+ start:195 stop:443 length:249 start_codon:yes stop_codon:yes gene_type:complete